MEEFNTLFKKYLRNECNSEELKKILNWMKDNGNKNALETIMKEDWDLLTSEELNHKEAFKSIKSKINQKNISSYRKNKKFNLKPIIPANTKKITYRVAASIIIPVTIGILTFVLLDKQKDTAITFNEITVPLGSKTKIQLADGTKIWLNSGSKLKYPQKFNGKSREVELIGEGFFDVAKNPAQPFIVKTSDINIKVLGTSFNVKSYPEEGTIETTLVKGLITLSQAKQNKNEIQLKPNQRATYIRNKGKIILSETDKKQISKDYNHPSTKTEQKSKNIIFTENIDIEQFIAWKDDKLVFKNEEFENLCIKLERWYNVKINLKSKELKKVHFTGIIQNETFNDLLKILQLTMHFEYETNHAVINIWTEKQL